MCTFCASWLAVNSFVAQAIFLVQLIPRALILAILAIVMARDATRIQGDLREQRPCVVLLVSRNNGHNVFSGRRSYQRGIAVYARCGRLSWWLIKSLHSWPRKETSRRFGGPFVIYRVLLVSEQTYGVPSPRVPLTCLSRELVTRLPRESSTALFLHLRKFSQFLLQFRHFRFTISQVWKSARYFVRNCHHIIIPISPIII